MFKITANNRKLSNTVKNANDPEYVKSLLSIKKEDVIMRLPNLIAAINPVENSALKEIYLKIMPVFLSYSEIYNVKIFDMLHVLVALQEHPLFSKEKSLFDDWYQRFLELKKKTMDPKNENSKRKLTLSEKNNSFRHISGTDFVETIGYSEINFFNSFHRYLKYHKLHKYLFFFANLSYYEIMTIDSNNIFMFEKKIDIFPMTMGARNAILRKLTDLFLRQTQLGLFCQDSFYTGSVIPKMTKCIEEVRNILKTPIRGSNMYQPEDAIPNLIIETLRKAADIFCKLNRTVHGRDQVGSDLCDLFKKAWAAYFFTAEQKAEFNHLRNRISTMLRRDKRPRKLPQQSAVPILMKPEKPLNLTSLTLDQLTLCFDQWMLTEVCH